MQTVDGLAAFVVVAALPLLLVAAPGQGGGGSGGGTGPGGGGFPTFSGTATPPPATPTGTGAISGIVTDGATGRPLAGASVSLFAPTGAQMMPFVGQHVTDSKGRFVFTDLGAAAYVVSVQRFGYLGADFGDAGHGGRAQITLPAAGWFQKADVALWKTGALTGTVVDERNESVVGVLVTAARHIFVAGRTHLAAGKSARTDDRGAYRLAGLDPGRYSVCVLSVQATVPTSVALDAGDMTADVSGYRMVIGRGPIPDPRTGPTFVYPTTCGPGGTAQGSPAAVEISRRDDQAPVDLRLQPVQAFRVSGRIDGERATGTVLRLIPAWSEDLGLGGEAATSIVEADGRFTFLNVPSGDYSLVASTTVGQFQSGSTMGPGASQGSRPPGFRMSSSSSMSLPSGDGASFTSISGGAGGAWGRSLVSVRRADVTEATLTLQRAVRVSGHVVFEGNAQRLPNLLVPTADPASGDAALGMPSTAVQNPQNGVEFTIDGLMSGAYLLRMRGPTTDWVIKSIAGGSRDYLNAPIDTSSGRDVDGLVITMTDRPATISGSVRDAGGTRPPDGAVIVFPVDRQAWTSYGLYPTRLRSITVTTGGTFEVPRLQAGEYYLAAVNGADARAWQDPQSLEQLSGAAMRVTVGWGETRSVTLTKVAR